MIIKTCPVTGRNCENSGCTGPGCAFLPQPVWSSPGWQCPGCGRCYAPWKNQCEACGPTVTSSTGANVRAQ